jgi:hypothetical protein
METSNAFQHLSSMTEMVDYLVKLQADRDQYKKLYEECFKEYKAVAEALDDFLKKLHELQYPSEEKVS